MILGFLYTFALIAYAGGEVDAIEFSTYENIWTLINALQTVAYAVLISVMFSTFIIKEYAGKLNLLLFTYPVDKSTLLKAKVLLVAFSGIGGMLLVSALIFLIFFITEHNNNSLHILMIFPKEKVSGTRGKQQRYLPLFAAYVTRLCGLQVLKN